MRNEGDDLVNESNEPRSLLALLTAFEPIEEDFTPVEDLPAEPFDL